MPARWPNTAPKVLRSHHASRDHGLSHRSRHSAGHAGRRARRNAVSLRCSFPSTHTSRYATTTPRRWSTVSAPTTTAEACVPLSRSRPQSPMTEHIGLGTGILLAAQHDPIVLAKQVATLDHLSGGRVTLGIGFGWNRAEAEDHGVDFAQRHAIVREHLLCMQELWSAEQAEFHGTFVDLPPAWAWPKPKQQPRVRVLIGGGSGDPVLAAVAEYADGWMPIGGSGLADAIPRLARLAEENGRDPSTIAVVPFGTIGTPSKLEHFASLGVTEVVLRVRSGDAAEVLAQLDSLAPLLPLATSLAS